HARELHAHPSLSGVNLQGTIVMGHRVRLMDDVVASPSILYFTPSAPKQTLQVTSRETQGVLLLSLECDNKSYTISPKESVYLKAGCSVSFTFTNSFKGYEGNKDGHVWVVLKAVLHSEPEHFTAPELEQMNQHRI